MEIIKAEKMGFCFGVAKAIEICNNILENETYKQKKIYVLGMLVHNEYVVKELENKGIKIVHEEEILNETDTLKEGDILVIRAHGITKKIFEKIKSKNVELFDATCVFVTNIRKTLMEMEENGYRIIFIGDKEHPEVKGIVSFGKNVIICSDLEQLKTLKIDPKIKYCLLTQTTLNTKKLENIKSYLENNHKNVRIIDKVCGATQERQEAVKKIAEISDIVIVIGGKHSSNTKKLYDVSVEINPATYLIHDKSDLRKEWFTGKDKIGITAGASTPKEIVIEIENEIKGGIFNV